MNENFFADVNKYGCFHKLSPSSLADIGKQMPYGTFRVDTKDVNTFLSGKFGLGVQELMKRYFIQQFGVDFGVSYSENSIFTYNKALTREELEMHLKAWRISSQFFIPSPSGPIPNYHDNSFIKFDLVDCVMDLSEIYFLLGGGFYFSYNNFDFWIRTSSQGDILVVYHERKKGA